VTRVHEGYEQLFLLLLITGCLIMALIVVRRRISSASA